MRICIVWYFDKAEWVWPNYRDGLKAAMEIIGRKHQVDWYRGTDIKVPDKYNFILNWDNSESEFIPQMRKLSGRKGLVLTTDLGLDIMSLRNYDVIFPEAQPVVDKIRPFGIRCIKAFGTDDVFFTPDPEVNRDIVWDAFYPATFSPWKRNNEFARKYKDKGLLLGTVQPDGFDILTECIANKTNVMIGYYPAWFVRKLYSMSKLVDITGYEGSGRTVLEAMSMDLPVRVANDNYKCQSYIKELRDSGLSPRDFVLNNYSAEIYAKQLMRGMENDQNRN